MIPIVQIHDPAKVYIYILTRWKCTDEDRDIFWVIVIRVVQNDRCCVLKGWGATRPSISLKAIRCGRSTRIRILGISLDYPGAYFAIL